MKVTTAIAVALTLALGVSFSAAAQEELHIKKKMPPFPDLVIMKATRDKASHTVTVWVMNRALGSKAANCTLKLFAYKYKNALELIDPSQLERVEYTRPVPELAGGQSYTTSFEIPKPEGEIKTALARLVVDSENDVTESKEGNNEWPFKSKQVTAMTEDRRVPAKQTEEVKSMKTKMMIAAMLNRTHTIARIGWRSTSEEKRAQGEA